MLLDDRGDLSIGVALRAAGRSCGGRNDQRESTEPLGPFRDGVQQGADSHGHPERVDRFVGGDDVEQREQVAQEPGSGAGAASVALTIKGWRGSGACLIARSHHIVLLGGPVTLAQGGAGAVGGS